MTGGATPSFFTPQNPILAEDSACRLAVDGGDGERPPADLPRPLHGGPRQAGD